MSATPKFFHKPSGSRGNAEHRNFLNTYHHFPFASYWEPLRYPEFGSLRVINEDEVVPGSGFGMHAHREQEIFSYIVSGTLEHKDSTGNLEMMKRGDIQMTSCGTGLMHSEYNRDKSTPVRFLQIWAKPSTSRLPVQYYTRHFTDEEKADKLVRIVAPVGDEDVVDKREGSGPIPIHSRLRVNACILTPGKSVQHSPTSAKINKTLIHNIMVSGYRPPEALAIAGGSLLRVSSGDQVVDLEEGDSVFIDGSLPQDLKFESSGGKNAEFLVYEMD